MIVAESEGEKESVLIFGSGRNLHTKAVFIRKGLRSADSHRGPFPRSFFFSLYFFHPHALFDPVRHENFRKLAGSFNYKQLGAGIKAKSEMYFFAQFKY